MDISGVSGSLRVFDDVSEGFRESQKVSRTLQGVSGTFQALFVEYVSEEFRVV